MVLLLVALVLLGLAAVPTIRLLRPASLLDAAIGFGVVASALVAASILISGALGILGRAPVLGLLAGWAIIAWALARRAGPRPALGRPHLRALRGHSWESILIALAAVALGVAVDRRPGPATVRVRRDQLSPDGRRELARRRVGRPLGAQPLLRLLPVQLGAGLRLADAVHGQRRRRRHRAVPVRRPRRALGGRRSCAAPACRRRRRRRLQRSSPQPRSSSSRRRPNYADVMVAAWALAGLHSIVRFAVGGQRSHLVVAGLAAGLLAGTKGTGIVWAAALTLLAIGVVVAFLRGRRLATGAAVRGLAAFVCALLALGSYWYARNWIEQGNPAYPFRVEVAGTADLRWSVRGRRCAHPAARRRRRPAARSDRPLVGRRPRLLESGQLRLPAARRRARPAVAVAGIAVADPARRSGSCAGAARCCSRSAGSPPCSSSSRTRWWSRFTIPLIAIGALAVVAAAAWSPRRWQRLAVRGARARARGRRRRARLVRGRSRCERGSAARATTCSAWSATPPTERSVGSLFFPEYAFLDQVPDDAIVAVDLRAPEVRFVYPLFGRRPLARGGAGRLQGRGAAGAWVVTGARTAAGSRARPTTRPHGSRRGQRRLRVWRPAG